MDNLLTILNKKLANSIKENRTYINHNCLSKLKSYAGNLYQNISEENLLNYISIMTEGFIDVLEKDDWKKFEEFIDTFSEKYFEGYTFEDIYKLYTYFSLVIREYIKERFSPQEACELIISMWDIIENVYTFADRKLYDHTNKKYQEEYASLRAIYETSFACTSTIRLKEIAAVAYQKLKDFIAMNGFYLAIYNEKENNLYYDYIVDQGSVLPSFSKKIDENNETLSTWVIKNKTSILIEDLEKEQLPTGISFIGEPPDPRSILIVPLILKNRVIGLISLQSIIPNSYNKKTLELIKIISNNIALAIDNASLYETAYEYSITDYLTGIYNRYYFIKTLDLEITRSKRYNSKFSLLLGDIDDFKKFNDNLGYVVGDEILKTVAKVIKENIRSSDILIRYGGDEFVIILPNSDKKSSIPLINRITNSLINTDPQISMSWGVLCYPDDTTNKDILISKVDLILKEAKRKKYK